MGADQVGVDPMDRGHLACPADTVGNWIGLSSRDYTGVLPDHQLGSQSMGEDMMGWCWFVGLFLVAVGVVRWMRNMDISYKDSCPSDEEFITK